jgi:hypothetical protein
MSERSTPAPPEPETAPAPDKGGWIDGETGEGTGAPPAPAQQPGIVPIRKPATETPPKKAS